MKRFHQFVKVQRGPVNAAIIDTLSGHVFQVPLEVLEQFEAGEHQNIEEFLTVAQEEQLVIDLDANAWIPSLDYSDQGIGAREQTWNIELHLEEGAPINDIWEAFRHHTVSRVYFYGEALPVDFAFNPSFQLKQKDFERCRKRTTVDGNFCKIQESIVRFNMRYNSCWGSVIAVTADGRVRPCIHSGTVIGCIEKELQNVNALIEKMNPFWTFNKDKVDICRQCEFRYICFDCREMAMRQYGKMDGVNPLCSYNPQTGEWKD